MSVALNTLQGARAGYETGALDRRAFDYVVGVVVSDFDLLAVLHQDSTLRSAAQKLASSVHELGVTAEAPDFGDTSELAQRTAPIGERCTAVGAPLSLTG